MEKRFAGKKESHGEWGNEREWVREKVIRLY